MKAVPVQISRGYRCFEWIVIASLLLPSACKEETSFAPTAFQKTDTAEENILYFFDPHCEDCKEVESVYLPEILRLDGLSPEEVDRVDVSQAEGIQALLHAERRFGFTCKSLAPTIVRNGGEVLCGLAAIRGACPEVR